MRRTALSLAVASLALSAVVAACGDDNGGTSVDPGVDATFGDVPLADTYVGSDDTSTTNPDPVRRLDFEQAFGDDQVACRGTSRCTIAVSYTERRTLKVVYTEDGVPTAGQVVKFALEVDNDGVGFLNTLSSVTDAAGIAQVETKAKEARIGQFVVKAWIDNAPVDPLFFDVVVTPKGQVPLTVVGTYTGSRPVGSYNVRLYKQDASHKPDCSDLLDLYENQTASQARDNIQLTQSAKFPDLDNLEADGSQTYTVFIFSTNQNGAIQAWGCDDTEAVVEWGKSKTVQVELIDRPPRYVGVYDIISRFDFVSAIPEPYRTWVDYVVSFFQSPSGTLLELACDLLTGEGEDLNSFCDLVFDVDGNGDLQLTTLGGFAADLIDSIIQSISEGSVFETIFQVGGDVADILKAFDIKGVLEFKVEPNAAGEWAKGEALQTWNRVRVKWSYGANCDPNTEENCGVQEYSFGAFQQDSAVVGEFSAAVANYFDLTIDTHSLDLHYGALVNFFLEKKLLGLVTGQDSVDSYEELLGFLVGGGVECLTPGIDELDCCQTFADKVGDEDGQINGGTESAVLAACSTITTAGPQFLRNTLVGLDADTGDTLTVGTLEPCTLADANNDMIIDTIGSVAAPCRWDVRLNVGGGTSFDAIFWGVRQE